MKYNEAVQSLKFKRDKRYAVTGDEPYIKTQFVSMARSLNPDVDFEEFWPDGESDAFSALSDGLFSEKLMVLNHVDDMDLDRLSEMMPKSPHTVLAVFSDDANLKGRAASTLLGRCSIVECVKMREYGNDYPAWVSSYIAGQKYGSDEGVPRSIYERIGSDMFTLSNEMKKLVLFKESDRHIEDSDVEKVVSVTAVKTAFDILDALMGRDVASALASFESYSAIRDGYVEIVAFLFSYFEKMYRAVLLRDRGHSVDAISDIVKIPKFLMGSRYLPKALGLGKEFIARQIDLLCDLDLGVRSFSGNKRVLVENFFYGFAQEV